MQLTEIKNDLATINYSPEINKLMLSDFILIEDANQSILAQIISIEATMEDDVNSAMLKFLLSIDKDANLTQYSGYVPAKSATLILINPEEVVQLIKGNDKNIYLGDLALYPDIPIELSLEFMRKRPYIQVDFVENKMQIVKTIIRGLEKHNKKTILIDFQGLYESLSLPTVTLGYNFKLPLNYDALCYIAEEELNDCNNENKAVIQGILIEVQNYVKSTEEQFIPFDTLISVLDAQYNESPMPELLLLKNKLVKYQQQGIFAQEKSEFDFLDTFLKDAKNFKFDLSELPPQWSKIAFISILNIIKAKCYLITEFTDDNSNKTIIKKLYERSEIKPIVISSFEYKYQLQLKAMSKNMILFKPIQKINDFAGYTSFLNILSQDTFIVWGEQTLFIPLILKSKNENKIEAKINRPISGTTDTIQQKIETASIEDNAIDVEDSEFLNSNTDSLIINDNNVIEENIEDYNIEDDIHQANQLVEEDIMQENQIIEEDIVQENQDISDDLAQENQIVEEDIMQENQINEEDVVQENQDISDDLADVVQKSQDISDDLAQENQVVEEDISQENKVLTEDLPLENQNFTEDIPLENQDTEEESPQTDNFEDSFDLPNGEDIDFFFEETIDSEEEQSILQDSTDNTELEDKTEFKQEENPIQDLEDIIIDEELNEIEDIEEQPHQEELNEIEDIEEQPHQEEINTTDDDNTISEEKDIVTLDEDYSDNEEEQEEAPAIPQKPIPEAPNSGIPVYNSNSAPQFDTKFAEGTYVHHPKYGRGVVEKVTAYGSKELCMIIFDDAGRKLLDPNIAELKQI